MWGNITQPEGWQGPFGLKRPLPTAYRLPPTAYRLPPTAH